jgi:hypothetical protein
MSLIEIAFNLLILREVCPCKCCSVSGKLTLKGKRF